MKSLKFRIFSLLFIYSIFSLQFLNAETLQLNSQMKQLELTLIDVLTDINSNSKVLSQNPKSRLEKNAEKLVQLAIRLENDTKLSSSRDPSLNLISRLFAQEAKN